MNEKPAISNYLYGDLARFFWGTTCCIDIGVPLVPSLAKILDDIRSEDFRECIRRIEETVNTGLSFFEAMDQHPTFFPSGVVEMVKDGEMTGRLQEISEVIAKTYFTVEPTPTAENVDVETKRKELSKFFDRFSDLLKEG